MMSNLAEEHRERNTSNLAKEHKERNPTCFRLLEATVPVEQGTNTGKLGNKHRAPRLPQDTPVEGERFWIASTLPWL